MEQEKNNQSVGKRHLKVYEKYMSRSYHRYVVLPEIRLCGKWLQEMGFQCGQKVTVGHQKNKIIITLDHNTQMEE